MKRKPPVDSAVALVTPASSRSSGARRPLTARAVADLCGVELKTVHNWVAEGRLDYFRTPGRHLRFHHPAVQQFLAECGYQQSSVGAAKRTVVVVKGASLRSLREAFQRWDVVEVKDVASALLAIGKSEPDVLLIDVAKGGAVPDVEVFQALARFAPATRVVLVGNARQATPPRVMHGAHFVTSVPAVRTLVNQLPATKRH